MRNAIASLILVLSAIVPAAALNADAAGEAAGAAANPYAIVGMGFLVIAGILVYFLPTFIAGARRLESFPAIFMLDFLLGWTIVGWFVSLFYAMRVNPPPAQADLEIPSMPRQNVGR